MTWRWLIYAAIFTCTKVFSKDATRMKRSDEDVNKPCEDGWYRFRQKCYTRDKSAGSKSWIDAAYTCFSNHGGDLVSIHSKEELDFLITFIILEYRYAVWIGFQNRAKQSEFSWSDNSLVNYTNWMDGRPKSDDTCTLMLYNLPGNDNVLGKWFDHSCADDYAFICQRKIGVDNCVLKCGKNPGVKCSGDRFDVKAIKCNCTEEGHSFDEERKECRVDYCFTKCNELPDVECINRFDKEAVECKCKAAGLSFDGERAECRVSTDITDGNNLKGSPLSKEAVIGITVSIFVVFMLLVAGIYFLLLPWCMRRIRVSISSKRGNTTEIPIEDEYHIYEGIEYGWHFDRSSQQLSQFPTTSNVMPDTQPGEEPLHIYEPVI